MAHDREPGRETGLGTGVIVNASGAILTSLMLGGFFALLVRAGAPDTVAPRTSTSASSGCSGGINNRRG